MPPSWQTFFLVRRKAHLNLLLAHVRVHDTAVLAPFSAQFYRGQLLLFHRFPTKSLSLLRFLSRWSMIYISLSLLPYRFVSLCPCARPCRCLCLLSLPLYPILRALVGSPTHSRA